MFFDVHDDQNAGRYKRMIVFWTNDKYRIQPIEQTGKKCGARNTTITAKTRAEKDPQETVVRNYWQRSKIGDHYGWSSSAVGNCIFVMQSTQDGLGATATPFPS